MLDEFGENKNTGLKENCCLKKNVEEVMLRCVRFVKEINFDPTNFNPAFFGGRGGVGPIFISHKSSNVLEIR